MSPSSVAQKLLPKSEAQQSNIKLLHPYKAPIQTSTETLEPAAQPNISRKNSERKRNGFGNFFKKLFGTSTERTGIPKTYTI